MWGCNLFFKHPQAKNLKFAGYIDLDPPSAHENHPDPYWREGGYHRELAAFLNSIDCQLFQCLQSKSFCKKWDAHYKRIAYLQSAGLITVSHRLRNDIAGRFNMMDGVVFAMIGAASYLGFKEIILVGCDYTFQPQQVGHFYDDFVRLDYQPVNIRHVKVAKYMRELGVRVRNLVPDGFESPVYEKITMKEVLDLLT